MKHTRRHLIVALSLYTAIIIPRLAIAVAVSGQGTWETTLQGRDLDGNLSTVEAYYDTKLNITWLSNTNIGAGTIIDDGVDSSDGLMTWSNANAWAASLNINGITNWRLPNIIDTANPGCDGSYSGADCGYNVDTASSEMAHLFYTTLGNNARYDIYGTRRPSSEYGVTWGLVNSGPFNSLRLGDYWSSTEYILDANYSWLFSFSNGSQQNVLKAAAFLPWAVHAGDVGIQTIPIPAVSWLFGSGLVGLWSVLSRKKIIKKSGAINRNSLCTI